MDEHVVKLYARAPEVFTHGRGATLFDSRGEEYLDLLGGIAVNALGHGHAGLAAALAEQASALLHTSNLYRHPHTEAVAERLARWTGLDSVFFCNSGTEANEAALKLARAHFHRKGRPREKFCALEGGFHGRTLGALSVTHNPRYRAPFEPLCGETRFVPPDDADALAAALVDESVAALILEPIQGESGVRALDPAFLRAARELCDRTGTLLVHDEVQCGSGRTGSFLAAAAHGVSPDLVTLAKPLGGGLPMGALVVSERFAASLTPGDHGSTFGGGPLASRAALVFLDELEAGLLDNVEKQGALLGEGLRAIASDFPCVLEVRGRGLMRGLRLDRPVAPLVRALHERRVLAGSAGNDVLRLLPPYVITASEVERGLEILCDALETLT